MKKKNVIKNILLICTFILINCILILIERIVKESTFELIGFAWCIALLVGLIIMNYNIYENVKPKFKRFLLTDLVIGTLFVFNCVIIYFLNWYIIYPIMS